MKHAFRSKAPNCCTAIESLTHNWLCVSATRLRVRQVKLFYAQGEDVEYTSPQLKQRYACAEGGGAYHRLKLKTFGTLTNGQRRVVVVS